MDDVLVQEWKSVDYNADCQVLSIVVRHDEGRESC